MDDNNIRVALHIPQVIFARNKIKAHLIIPNQSVKSKEATAASSFLSGRSRGKLNECLSCRANQDKKENFAIATN